MTDRTDYWERIYRKPDSIVSRNIAGETLLVPIRGKLADMRSLYSLNPVAEVIWNGIDGTTPLGTVRDRVMETFAVDRDRAEIDIRSFIDDLIGADLISGSD